MKKYTIIAALLGSLLAFQNCSDVSFQSMSDTNNNPQCLPPDCPTPVPPGEEFNINHLVTANNEKRADILFIVDTSGSMDYEQTQIQSRFPNFIQGLAGIDWRIAITNAIMVQRNYPAGYPVSGDIPGSGNRLIPFVGAPANTMFITPSMGALAEQYFIDTIRRPVTCGGNINCDNHERGIYKANLLIDNRAQLGFFRPGSNVNVIIVSDENERSDGGSLENYDRPANLVANAANLQARSFTTHSIIVKPGDTDCFDTDDRQHYGYVYRDVSELTGGEVGSVCATDYTEQLNLIADNILTTTKSILLPCVPDGNVIVSSTPQLPSSYEHVVQANRLVFNMDLPAGTNLNIRGTCKP